VAVEKAVTKNKFVQKRGKQRTAGAKLSFKLTLGQVFSILWVWTSASSGFTKLYWCTPTECSLMPLWILLMLA